MFKPAISLATETIFSGNPLDRADLLRLETDLLERHMNADGTRILAWYGDRVLSARDGSLIWQSPAECPVGRRDTAVFLGLDSNDRAHWAKVEHGSHAVREQRDGPADIKPRDLRGLAMKETSNRGELAIAAQAKAMLGWHRRHGFCAHCGAETTMRRAGYERHCSRCDTIHYPRTDPVVIMLALRDGKALVGRGPEMDTGMLTALAGFMEPGERIEEAVARELKEETDLTTLSVRYIASQPWPWPSTLMIGCFADVADGAVTLDTTEVEDALWITKDEARQLLAEAHPTHHLPPSVAIARQLVEVWVQKD